MERYVSDLPEESYSYSIIEESCKNHDFAISKLTIGNVIYEKGKNRRILVDKEKNSSKYLSELKSQSF